MILHLPWSCWKELLLTAGLSPREQQEENAEPLFSSEHSLNCLSLVAFIMGKALFLTNSGSPSPGLSPLSRTFPGATAMGSTRREVAVPSRSLPESTDIHRVSPASSAGCSAGYLERKERTRVHPHVVVNVVMDLQNVSSIWRHRTWAWRGRCDFRRRRHLTELRESRSWSQMEEEEGTEALTWEEAVMLAQDEMHTDGLVVADLTEKQGRRLHSPLCNKFSTEEIIQWRCDLGQVGNLQFPNILIHKKKKVTKNKSY